MKVKDLLKKYRMCSNADVFLQTGGELQKLSQKEISELAPERLMTATVRSFDVIDNVITIYIRIYGGVKDDTRYM